MILPFPLSQSDQQMQRVRHAVEQHRNAPFRSADWLAGELMTICETAPANDDPPAISTPSPDSGERMRDAEGKYADLDIHERAVAMADDCAGDPWELLGYFRQKLDQAENDGETARDAAVQKAQTAVRYRQALQDVTNPLGYLQRMAEAEGGRLNGMAYAIANDVATVQQIARAALQEPAR